MEKKKSYPIIAVFALLIFGLAIAHLLIPDAELSKEERRKLAQMPEVSLSEVFKAEFSGKVETYLLDQFPLRQQFRTIQALLRYDVLFQKDNNDVYIVDDQVLKMEYPLKEEQVNYAANKIAKLYEDHMKGMNVYCAIVPDKNYFAAEENGYLALDYERMMELLFEKLPEGVQYVDIFDTLSLEDYYFTDTHWRQEAIFPVVQALAEAMGVADVLTPESAYTAETIEDFYGVYYSQGAVPVAPDTLTYLKSEYTESAIVTGPELKGETSVYVPERFDGMDGYDVFLSGAQAILEIEVPNAKTDRELIIFRDSYGSSIAPLLTGAYSKITLVDLRYVASQYLTQFVSFENQDVLFLYSTSILNSGMLLK